MGIIKTAVSFWKLFKAGNELDNATLWKNRTRAVNAVTVFLTAILGVLEALGHKYDIPKDILEQIATGVVGCIAAFNWVMHTITSARVGLQSNASTDNKTGGSGNTNSLDGTGDGSIHKNGMSTNVINPDDIL